MTIWGVIAVALLSAGCLERAELRLQHCAQVAIERHGVEPPQGAYGVRIERGRCRCRLWSGLELVERLPAGWRPE